MLRCLMLDSPCSSKSIDDLRRYRSFIDAVEISVDPEDPPDFDRVKTLCEKAPPVVILSCPNGSGKEGSRHLSCEEILVKFLQPGITHVSIEEGVVCPDLEE